MNIKLKYTEAAKKYRENGDKLATLIVQISELRNSFKFLSEKYCDNGDPYLSMDESLIRLGEALAHSITYANEYISDAEAANKEEH